MSDDYLHWLAEQWRQEQHQEWQAKHRGVEHLAVLGARHRDLVSTLTESARWAVGTATLGIPRESTTRMSGWATDLERAACDLRLAGMNFAASLCDLGLTWDFLQPAQPSASSDWITKSRPWLAPDPELAELAVEDRFGTSLLAATRAAGKSWLAEVAAAPHLLSALSSAVELEPYSAAGSLAAQRAVATLERACVESVGISYKRTLVMGRGWARDASAITEDDVNMIAAWMRTLADAGIPKALCDTVFRDFPVVYDHALAAARSKAKSM
ncbi:hypothetical protein [Mycobacterium sp. 1245852.3]|uniref:hypothetical protein n=1 Tax=Mycobacterium sp. 1245852.3 TaxID=1856860 RepID=UPI0007FF8603|nr:hypothetical protein [Mycobacterium sp. 1245852.3]OBK15280.1 hypothetical protein A9W96_08845 [Mycobacterium sp. 1245852.3]